LFAFLFLYWYCRDNFPIIQKSFNNVSRKENTEIYIYSKSQENIESKNNISRTLRWNQVGLQTDLFCNLLLLLLLLLFVGFYTMLWISSAKHTSVYIRTLSDFYTFPNFTCKLEHSCIIYNIDFPPPSSSISVPDVTLL